MRFPLSYTMFWALAVCVLAGTGFLTLGGPFGWEQAQRQGPPLENSPLVGVWNAQGVAMTYQINITPSVLFITSRDEVDICEIEVLDRASRTSHNSLHGIIRLHRMDRENLPHVGDQIEVYCEQRGDVLVLSWPESFKLSTRFTGNRMIAVRGSKPERTAVDSNETAVGAN